MTTEQPSTEASAPIVHPPAEQDHLGCETDIEWIAGGGIFCDKSGQDGLRAAEFWRKGFRDTTSSTRIIGTRHMLARELYHNQWKDSFNRDVKFLLDNHEVLFLLPRAEVPGHPDCVCSLTVKVILDDLFAQSCRQMQSQQGRTI